MSLALHDFSFAERQALIANISKAIGREFIKVGITRMPMAAVVFVDSVHCTAMGTTNFEHDDVGYLLEEAISHMCKIAGIDMPPKKTDERELIDE